jgi:hypothetical protein
MPEIEVTCQEEKNWRIKLTPQEAEMLREILVRYQPELRREIADTEKKDFRHFLQGLEVFMNDFIKRLQ